MQISRKVTPEPFEFLFAVMKYRLFWWEVRLRIGSFEWLVSKTGLKRTYIHALNKNINPK